jgi:hypothetical protein
LQEYFYNYEPPKSKVLSACKSCHALFLFGIVFDKISVADPNYLDADPNADPDPTFHFEADPGADPDLACHFNADSDPDADPTFHFDADPDPDSSFQIKTQNL